MQKKLNSFQILHNNSIQQKQQQQKVKERRNFCSHIDLISPLQLLVNVVCLMVVKYQDQYQDHHQDDYKVIYSHNNNNLHL
jgi:hypothetical protein